MSAAGASAFGNLGPSTGMGPNVSIGSSNTPGGGGAGGFGGLGGAGGMTGYTGIPTVSNPLANYYYSPLQYGINTGSGGSVPAANSLRTNFGQPLYGTANTMTTQAAGGAGVGAATNQGAGFTTLGRSRAPAYYTALSPHFPMPHRPVTRLQNDLQGVLQNTFKNQITFKSRPIQVSVGEGGRVVLRGTVANEYDRERAEDQARITPGVEDVVNELTVVAPTLSGGATGQQASLRQVSFQNASK